MRIKNKKASDPAGSMMRKGKVEERDKGVSMVNEFIKKIVICPTNEMFDRLKKKKQEF